MKKNDLDFYFITYRKDSLVMQGLAYASEIINLINDQNKINLIPVYAKNNDTINIPEAESENITVMLNPKVGKMPDYSNKWLKEFNNDIDLLDKLLKENLGEFNYVNSPASIKLLRDKVAMSKAIGSSVHHPTLYEGLGVDEIIEILMQGRPLCIKPIAGTEGSGVTRIRYTKKGEIFQVHTMYDKETATKKDKELDSKKSPNYIRLKTPIAERFIEKLLNYGVIIQDWIEPKRVCYDGILRIFDYRILGVYPKCIKEITSELWRISLNDLVTNLSAEGNQRSTYYQMAKLIGSNTIYKARKVGLKAFDNFPGLNIAAVDLLPSQDGCWNVIELNAFPDIGTERYGVPRYPFILLGALKDHGIELDDKLEGMLKLTFPNTAQKIVERLM